MLAGLARRQGTRPLVLALDRADRAGRRRVVGRSERLVLDVGPGEWLVLVPAVPGDVEVEPARVSGPFVVGEGEVRSRGEVRERPVPDTVVPGEARVTAGAELAVGDEALGAARAVRTEHGEPVVERVVPALCHRGRARGVLRDDVALRAQPVPPAHERPAGRGHHGAVCRRLRRVDRRRYQAGHQQGDGGQHRCCPSSCHRAFFLASGSAPSNWYGSVPDCGQGTAVATTTTICPMGWADWVRIAEIT